jgi:hypothetical protein
MNHNEIHLTNFRVGRYTNTRVHGNLFNIFGQTRRNLRVNLVPSGEIPPFGRSHLNCERPELPQIRRLCTVMVCVLAIRRKDRGFGPGRGSEFLRAIKTPSFGKEIQLKAPCRKILRNVEEPCVVWQRYYVSKIQGHFSLGPCFASRCVCCNQRALVDESEVIRTQMGTHNRSENDSSAWEDLYLATP